jgi:hypothetical protein
MTRLCGLVRLTVLSLAACTLFRQGRSLPVHLQRAKME